MNAKTFIAALRELEERGDAERLISLYREDAETRNPTDPEPHEGVDGAREFWTKYRDSFEDIHSEFHAVVENDGCAVLEWTSTGTSASGDPVHYDGVSVVEYDDGGIRRFRAYFDPTELRH